MKLSLAILALITFAQTILASEFRATVYALRCPSPGIPDLKDSSGKILVLDYHDSSYFLDVVARGMGTITIVAEGDFTSESGAVTIGKTATLRIDSGNGKPEDSGKEYGVTLNISELMTRIRNEGGVEIPLMQMKVRIEATLSEDEKLIRLVKNEVIIKDKDLTKVGSKNFDGHLGVIKGIPGITVVPFNDRMALLVRIYQIE